MFLLLTRYHYWLDNINGIDLAKLIYCITSRTRICGGYIMIYHDIFIVTGVYKSSKHDWVAPPCDQRLETAKYFKQVSETIVGRASTSLGTPEVGPLTLIASMVCDKSQI